MDKWVKHRTFTQATGVWLRGQEALKADFYHMHHSGVTGDVWLEEQENSGEDDHASCSVATGNPK